MTMRRHSNELAMLPGLLKPVLALRRSDAVIRGKALALCRFTTATSVALDNLVHRSCGSLLSKQPLHTDAQ
jgi:hypothetical protein